MVKNSLVAQIYLNPISLFPYLIHILHFHPPVLKPDFDLSLTQIEESGHFMPAVPGEVHIEQKDRKSVV